MGHGKKELLTEAVFPIMRVKGTIFCGISSPSGCDNFFNVLMNCKSKRTGKPIFAVLRQTMVCVRCIQMNNIECKHLLYLLPSWQNSLLNELVDEMYESLDCGDTKRNELYGLVNRFSNGMVSAAALKEIEDHPPFRWADHVGSAPNHVYIGHDPNAAGECHTGLAAITFIANQVVVRNHSKHCRCSVKQVARVQRRGCHRYVRFATVRKF